MIHDCVCLRVPRRRTAVGVPFLSSRADRSKHPEILFRERSLARRETRALCVGFFWCIASPLVVDARRARGVRGGRVARVASRFGFSTSLEKSKRAHFGMEIAVWRPLDLVSCSVVTHLRFLLAAFLVRGELAGVRLRAYARSGRRGQRFVRACRSRRNHEGERIGGIAESAGFGGDLRSGDRERRTSSSAMTSSSMAASAFVRLARGILTSG